MNYSIFEEELIELENEALFYGTDESQDPEDLDWDDQVQLNASRANYIWKEDSWR